MAELLYTTTKFFYIKILFHYIIYMKTKEIISKLILFIILSIIIFFFLWHLKSEINYIQDDIIKKERKVYK